jgi:hypothetical protein
MGRSIGAVCYRSVAGFRRFDDVLMNGARNGWEIGYSKSFYKEM